MGGGCIVVVKLNQGNTTGILYNIATATFLLESYLLSYVYINAIHGLESLEPRQDSGKFLK